MGAASNESVAKYDVGGTRVTKMNLIRSNAAVLCAFALLALSRPSFAMDSTMVLPESVNSPSVRMGVVSGIGMKFMSGGDLVTLGDMNSIQFDAKTLAKFEPRVEQLIAVLNQFGNQKLGDQLSLGVLHVDTKPEVRYLAPVYARGITTNWTLGFGVPVLTYKNKLSLRQEGSNVDAIKATVGNAIPKLNEGFDQVNVNLADTAQEIIVKKGYRRLEDRDQNQIGDVQLVSLLQFAKEERTSFQWKVIGSLPTGEGKDPDDLASLGAFGYASVENQILGNYILNGHWRFAARTGYRYTFADQVTRRVPLNEDDSLPDQTTKEKVTRQTGGAAFVGGSVTYNATETLDFALGFESTRKDGDVYAGTKQTRYDLLGRDTTASSDRIRMGVTYSSVDTFLAGRAWLPTMIAYEFSDSIRGTNIERMTIHELWLQLFF